MLLLLSILAARRRRTRDAAPRFLCTPTPTTGQHCRLSGRIRHRGHLSLGIYSCLGPNSVLSTQPLTLGVAGGAGFLAADLQSPGDVRALSLAHALSMRSTHPVSRAVTAMGAAVGNRLPQVNLQDFRLVAGGLLS